MSCLLVLGLVAAASTTADDALRVDWVRTGSTARARCVDAERFEAEVRRRLSTPDIDGRVEGWIEGGPGRWKAELRLRRPSGAKARRTLRDDSPTCARVGAAASLSAALLLDPLSDTGASDAAPRATVVSAAAPPPSEERVLELAAGASLQVGSVSAQGDWGAVVDETEGRLYLSEDAAGRFDRVELGTDAYVAAVLIADGQLVATPYGESVIVRDLD